mmetsp:Transcript_5091/g.10201  ORF Transcript_5091/g.10201 Transcript_5091/m.10201 type:complete len:158 (-) Transcript_5091:81-554(-)
MKSTRMKVASMSQYVSFWGYRLAQAVVCIGWPRPFVDVAAAVAYAGGVGGILCETTMGLSLTIEEYLDKNLAKDNDSKKGCSRRAQVHLDECLRRVLLDPSLSAQADSCVWGYNMGLTLYPFDDVAGSGWARVQECGRVMREDWVAMGTHHLLPHWV